MTNISPNKFCSACGNALIETAVVCPKCGSPTARFAQINTGRPNTPGTPVVYGSEPKTKSTSVLLAVFLGTWSFLYTYKRDAVLFWVSLGVQVFFFFAILSSGTTSGSSAAFGFIAFIFWLLSVITTASRAPDWYARYPNF